MFTLRGKVQSYKLAIDLSQAGRATPYFSVVVDPGAPGQPTTFYLGWNYLESAVDRQNAQPWSIRLSQVHQGIIATLKDALRSNKDVSCTGVDPSYQGQPDPKLMMQRLWNILEAVEIHA